MLNCTDMTYQMWIVCLFFHCIHHRYVAWLNRVQLIFFSSSSWLPDGPVTSRLTNRSLVRLEKNAYRYLAWCWFSLTLCQGQGHRSMFKVTQEKILLKQSVRPRGWAFQVYNNIISTVIIIVILLSHIAMHSIRCDPLIQMQDGQPVCLSVCLCASDKIHVVHTCTNQVSSNHLPVIVTSDRPQTTLLTCAH